MNRSLFLYLYLPFLANAVKKIADFPDIYLYTDEVYVGKISDYITGNDIAIELNETDPNSGVFFECSYKFGINHTEFINFPGDPSSSQYKLIATENIYDFTILALTNDTIILLSLSKLDLSLNVTFNQTLNGKYPDASIISGILTQSNIIVLIESTEKIQNYNFTRNDILYAGYEERSLKISSNFWDLRFRKDILMSTTDSNYVAFAVQDDGNEKGGIYVFLFNKTSSPILVQVIDKFKYVPTYVSQDSFPTIVDLSIQNNFLTLLTHDNLVVVFEYLSGVFCEQTFSNFSEFGQAKHIGHMINSFNYLTVTANNYAVIYDLNALSKIFYAKSRVVNAEVVYAQDFLNYMFFSSTTNNKDSYMEIVFLSYNSIQNIALVNISQYVSRINPSGSWLVFETVFSNVLIRQDFDGIHLFELSLPTYQFQVSSSDSVNLTIIASDSESSIASIMSITILKDLWKIYYISEYFVSNLLSFTYPVYFVNLTQTQEFSIYEILSGWNLTFTVNHVDSDYFNYSVVANDDFYHLTELQLMKSYIDSGFYSKVLYLIDSEGYVYKNQTKLHLGVDGALAIQSISSTDPDIAILYKDSIICYYNKSELFSKIRKSFNCDKFLTQEDIVVCASNYSVNILSCSLKSIITSIYFYEEDIKDVAICQNYIHNITYIYVLFVNDVFMYQLYETEIVLLNKKSISVDRILCYFDMVITIQDLHLNIFSELLEYSLRTFELYTGYQNILMADNILLFQNNEEVYYYDIESSVLNSLLNVYYIGPCTIKSLDSNILLTNCTSYLDFYISPCPPDCSKVSKVQFNLTNVKGTTQGYYGFPLPIEVTNSVESFTFNITFHLNTYESVIFFDESEAQYNYSYEFDEKNSVSLKYYLNGYSFDTFLLFDDVGQNVSNQIEMQSVSLTGRSSLSYNFTFLDTLIDYALIPDIDVVVYITENQVRVFGNKTHISAMGFTEINTNYLCNSINFISRDEKSAVFVCDCLKINNISGYYYDGKLTQILQNQPFLLFLTLDLVSFEFYLNSTFLINFTPRLIKIVNNTPYHFLVLCVSSKLQEYQNFFNDEIFVFEGIWKDDRNVSVVKEYLVNFFTLGIENFSVMHFDGIFFHYDKKNKKTEAFLYVADSFYGILVIELYGKDIRIVQQISLLGNPPVSLAVCGSNLYVITLKSAVIVYNINDDYFLKFYVTYPSSSIEIYYGLNSITSCSNYYDPTYLSFYLQEYRNPNNFILRVISLTSSFNSSVHKDFQISISNKVKVNFKSIFKSSSLISFLSNKMKTYEENELNDITLVFKNMTYEEYQDLLKFYPNGQIAFNIQANKTNDEFYLTSKKFILTRTGNSESSSSGDEVNYIYIILVSACGILVVLIVISYCVFKRIINKKKVKPDVVQGRFRLQTLSWRYSRMSLSWNDTYFNS